MVFGPFFSTFIALTNIISYFTGSGSDKSVATPLGETSEETSLVEIGNGCCTAGNEESRQPTRKCRKRCQRENASFSIAPEIESKRAKVVGHLDGLRFLKILGQGAFGQVSLYQDNCGQTFAVKNLIEPEKESLAIEKSIMKLGSRGWSKFIVKLDQEFTCEGQEIVVMEYVSGGDLLCDINKHQNRYTEPTARFYISEIICGLEFLHLFGIVHRDLKFENVLITSSGHIKIADFGLAYRLKPGTSKIHQQTICGTPIYIAPEVILQNPYDSCCDWWSLGVMVFMMLTSSIPFQGESTEQLFYKIIYENPIQPDLFTMSLLSMEGVDLFLHLLEKIPNYRIGYKGGCYPSIRDHPFFHSVNWDMVETQQLDPPDQNFY